MGKIDDIIAERNIKPSDCQYHTNRVALGKSKQPSGRIRILALSGTAHVEYKCPECGHAGYTEQEWKRPFSAKCEKCSFRISVPKMKEQAKKELKGKSSRRDSGGAAPPP